MQRESIDYDVVIVGAGPAGLSAACRIKQMSPEASVCVLEKSAEIGGHILSGAVFETRALCELFPNWKKLGAPVTTPVTHDTLFYLRSDHKAFEIPASIAPKTLRNEGNYVISLGNLCRWLAEQAESLEVELFPGFAASEILFENDKVAGVITGDQGISKSGKEKTSFEPGMEIRGKFTIFAEGARGHLGKQLIRHFELDKNKDPQHFGLGIKELWNVPTEHHHPGKVIHTAGWPLTESHTRGGGFLYHLDNNQVVVGLVTDLSYSNPNVSPFDEFQRYKHHPQISKYLKSGERICYGARAIAKGGIQSQPKMVFAGGLLIGDDAGTLNFAKIKGSHTAMKSGLIAGETVAQALSCPKSLESGRLDQFESEYKKSWAYQELFMQRNFGPAQHKWGNLLGSAYAFIDINLFNGALPWTLRDKKPDHTTLRPAQQCKNITYPKPDGKISFDKLSSVFISNTNHEEDQPSHLKLANPKIPIESNLPLYQEPAQRYCPAGVYEILVDENQAPYFQINAQNCVHCKTCDIKDPSQNITWVTPEGSGGPNYPNM